MWFPTPFPWVSCSRSSQTVLGGLPPPLPSLFQPHTLLAPPWAAAGIHQPLQCADSTHMTEENQASKLDQFTEVSKKCQNERKISTKSVCLGKGRGEGKAHPQQKPVGSPNHAPQNRNLRVSFQSQRNQSHLSLKTPSSPSLCAKMSTWLSSIYPERGKKGLLKSEPVS